MAAWKAQWKSEEAFVSWWSQAEQKSKKEGVQRWGGVACPLAVTCEACGEKGTRYEVCEFCEMTWFLCEKCG